MQNSAIQYEIELVCIYLEGITYELDHGKRIQYQDE